MDLTSPFSYDIFLRLAVAMILGMAIGAERVYAHKAAGMRTYSMVAMGAALFVAISQIIESTYMNTASFDPLRMASQIVVGVGFLGSGLIVFKNDKLSGITSASSLWVAAGIGVACGFGLFGLAIMTTLITLFIFLVIWVVEQRFKTALGDGVPKIRKTKAKKQITE
jgi:putative Mg2+ transporter-C (MgtC) family protein